MFLSFVELMIFVAAGLQFWLSTNAISDTVTFQKVQTYVYKSRNEIKNQNNFRLDAKVGVYIGAVHDL